MSQVIDSPSFTRTKIANLIQSDPRFAGLASHPLTWLKVAQEAADPAISAEDALFIALLKILEGSLNSKGCASYLLKSAKNGGLLVGPELNKKGKSRNGHQKIMTLSFLEGEDGEDVIPDQIEDRELNASRINSANSYEQLLDIYTKTGWKGLAKIWKVSERQARNRWENLVNKIQQNQQHGIVDLFQPAIEEVEGV
ncbi:MAG: hypothetical protein KGI54_12610 [Pseudomonadota bacterium]|nr:hypothetical protein [Pseudomonadota bacterium]